MKTGLSTEQLIICDRIAEAIGDEDSARNMYPELNRDVVRYFKDVYNDSQLLRHIAEDEDHHWHDLMKIYEKHCK
jgi:rubrerythrin